MKDEINVAIIQFTPIHMDKKKSIKKLADMIREAGQYHPELIITGETCIPTYPYWRNRYSFFDQDPVIVRAWSDVSVEYYRESVNITKDLHEICEAARSIKSYCMIGISEQDDKPGSCTLYNTQVLIDKEGHIIGRRRKLMPTHEERAIWGWGTSEDLRVWNTDIGNIGGLICYENHMPTLQAAMTILGEEIHCCCWPGYRNYIDTRSKENEEDRGKLLGSTEIDVCIKAYAFQTQTFVLSASLYVPLESVPDDFIFKQYGNWSIAIGGSAIVSPLGHYLAGPIFDREAILHATLDANDRIRLKSRFDTAGHYRRDDIIKINLNP